MKAYIYKRCIFLMAVLFTVSVRVMGQASGVGGVEVTKTTMKRNADLMSVALDLDMGPLELPGDPRGSVHAGDVERPGFFGASPGGRLQPHPVVPVPAGG